MRGAAKWTWMLAVWTLAIWGSRLRNAVADDELSGSELLQAVGIAAVFVGLAIVLGVGLLRRGVWTAPALIVLVIAGVIRWTIRGPVILLSDEWDTGFKIVHTVLWLVTVALSAMAWREGRALDARADLDGGYDSGHGSARIGH